MIPDKQFLFIIGAPRSGTTWLQAMVAAHPAVCSTIDELKLFDFFTVPLEKGWQYLLGLQKETGGGRNGLAAMWTDDEFYAFLSDFVGSVYSQVLAKKPEATVLLDKAPAYSTCVGHIDRLIPRAKFVHVIRDGRDVAVSLMSAAQSWGKSWAPKKVAAAASAWKAYAGAAQDARQFRGRYLEVRYEELLTNGVQVLRSVFDFIGLPIDAAEVAAIYDRHQFENMKQEGTGANNFSLPKEFFRKGEAGDWRNSLNLGERYIFDETAGDLLRALGYADALWWCDHPYQRMTVPLRMMLSSRNRLKMKAVETIKRALGPKWTERIRTARSRSRGKDTLQATVNG